MSSIAPETLPERASARRIRGPVAALLGVGAAWAAVALVRPGDAGPIPCPWRAITGLDCPFCGATRSAAALANGDVVLALDHNAFFVLVIVPLAAAAWLTWMVRAWQGRPAVTITTRALVVLLALAGAWWALRLAVPWLGSTAG
jgi:hypothetical protein